MKIIHCGETFDCAVAVKCEADKYIKLYDASGAEIVAFHDISDFSDYTIEGGTFVAPCDCTLPISLKTYSIGGRTITSGEWIASDAGYYVEIANSLISSNTTTCNIMLLFAPGTEFEYSARQEEGKIVIIAANIPFDDVVISGIQITRA